MSVLEQKSPDAQTLSTITENLEKMPLVPHVGCKEHTLTLTHRITTFYLTTRMFFVARQCNKNNEEREKTKEKRKAAKLTVSSEVLSQEPEVLMKKSNKNKTSKSSSNSAKCKEEPIPKKSPKNCIDQPKRKILLRDISNF